MVLDYDIVKSITVGASDVIETAAGIAFSRFTDKQRRLYCNRTEDAYLRSLSSSGIKLSFTTDSTILFMKIDVALASSRKYFSVDVYVNDTCVGYIDNFNTDTLPTFYTNEKFELGIFSKEFYLGEGEKQVTVYLPWSVSLLLKEVSLCDASFVEPFKRNKKLLAFGDSITQGYDALRPSGTYVSGLAGMLGCDEYNKGIGGEVFFPELATTKECFIPDYITVAYGTNDWVHKSKQLLLSECRCFFENIRQNYPNSEVFAITPIWRSDIDNTVNSMSFSQLTDSIVSCVDDLNISVIYGLELLAPDKKLFADGFVHPNDRGFEFYCNNLFDKIKEKRRKE